MHDGGNSGFDLQREIRKLRSMVWGSGIVMCDGVDEETYPGRYLAVNSCKLKSFATPIKSSSVIVSPHFLEI